MSKRAYQRYPVGFQEHAVARLKAGEKASHLAREFGFDRKNLYRWKRKVEGRSLPQEVGRERDPRDRRIQELQGRITQLEAVIGRQWLELDFFSSALRRVKGQAERSGGGRGATASTPKSAAGCRRKADSASSKCVH